MIVETVHEKNKRNLSIAMLTLPSRQRSFYDQKEFGLDFHKLVNIERKEQGQRAKPS